MSEMWNLKFMQLWNVKMREVWRRNLKFMQVSNVKIREIWRRNLKFMQVWNVKLREVWRRKNRYKILGILNSSFIFIISYHIREDFFFLYNHNFTVSSDLQEIFHSQFQAAGSSEHYALTQTVHCLQPSTVCYYLILKTQ